MPGVSGASKMSAKAFDEAIKTTGNRFYDGVSALRGRFPGAQIDFVDYGVVPITWKRRSTPVSSTTSAH